MPRQEREASSRDRRSAAGSRSRPGRAACAVRDLPSGAEEKLCAEQTREAGGGARQNESTELRHMPRNSLGADPQSAAGAMHAMPRDAAGIMQRYAGKHRQIGVRRMSRSTYDGGEEIISSNTIPGRREFRLRAKSGIRFHPV